MVQKKAKIIASEFFFVETYIIHYLETIIRKWGSLYYTYRIYYFLKTHYTSLWAVAKITW